MLKPHTTGKYTPVSATVVEISTEKKVVSFISEITHHYYTLFDACTGYNCSVFWFHEYKMKRK